MTTPPANSESEQQRREKSDRYFRLSQRRLKHAQEQLDLGDTVQASEKAYGAVSHAVKSYAELRGWNHYNHRVELILDQLRDEWDDPQLTIFHTVVKELHNNFFEYELGTTRAGDCIQTASLLLDKLETIRNAAPRPLPSTNLSREQRRRLSQLLQPPAQEQVPADNLPPLEDLPE
ncbi:MAG: hypothetical protein OXE17_07320 [Chloroflexi bacterium]|nr:hypothetical protein [Chloroflexota bacterium]